MQKASVQWKTKCIPNHGLPTNHPSLESLPGCCWENVFARLYKSGASRALNLHKALEWENTEPAPPPKQAREKVLQSSGLQSCKLTISYAKQIVKPTVFTIFCTDIHFVAAGIVGPFFEALKRLPPPPPPRNESKLVCFFPFNGSPKDRVLQGNVGGLHLVKPELHAPIHLLLLQLEILVDRKTWAVHSGPNNWVIHQWSLSSDLV